MAKILVVDDEADLEILIKQKFRQKIRQNEYEFVFALNGRHALEQLLEHKDVDVVLSDINMPEMDGLTLLSKLNELNGLMKSVIVSAYGDMDNIRTAMNRGAFDFVTKPVNFVDLEITIDRTIKHVQGIRDTIKAIKENNILKMYVDETVLNFMVGKDMESSFFDNEIIEGTVAFIDICGFTAISENEPADRVVNMLNAYFDIMVQEIIKEYGGEVNGNTTRDRTVYVETFPSNFTETALWMEADRMGFFLEGFTKEKFENQKKVMLEMQGKIALLLK
jgi:YesN/AraC family two-component response regulator